MILPTTEYDIPLWLQLYFHLRFNLEKAVGLYCERLMH